MPYYHATTKERIPNIVRHGLGGDPKAPRAFPTAQPGVYLATDPILAVGFLLERALNGEFKHLTPPQALEEFVVIVIDDSRIQPEKLHLDPNTPGWNTFFRYEGSIDVTAMPIVPAAVLRP